MSKEKTPEQQNPLRVIVLYSAGHLGSAMILNRLREGHKKQKRGALR